LSVVNTQTNKTAFFFFSCPGIFVFTGPARPANIDRSTDCRGRRFAAPARLRGAGFACAALADCCFALRAKSLQSSLPVRPSGAPKFLFLPLPVPCSQTFRASPFATSARLRRAASRSFSCPSSLSAWGSPPLTQDTESLPQGLRLSRILRG